jgi:CheY-specific phosphatase CheX
MTRVGGTQVTANNVDSIAKYFPHGMNVENLIAQTDAQVTDIAKIYVATRAETTIRIDAMTVDLLDPNVPTDTMIGLEYFDNLEITNVQPDSSTIVKTLQAQGLAWDITPNSMKVTVTTLEPIVEGFIIGSSNYGIIGQSIMGY